MTTPAVVAQLSGVGDLWRSAGPRSGAPRNGPQPFEGVLRCRVQLQGRRSRGHDVTLHAVVHACVTHGRSEAPSEDPALLVTRQTVGEPLLVDGVGDLRRSALEGATTIADLQGCQAFGGVRRAIWRQRRGRREFLEGPRVHRRVRSPRAVAEARVTGDLRHAGRTANGGRRRLLAHRPHPGPAEEAHRGDADAHRSDNRPATLVLRGKASQSRHGAPAIRRTRTAHFL